MEATRGNPPACRDRRTAAWSPCSPGRSGTPRTCGDVGIVPCSPVCSRHWGCWDRWSAPARWCSPCPRLRGRGLSGTAKEGVSGGWHRRGARQDAAPGGKQPGTSHGPGAETTTAHPVTPSPRWGPRATFPGRDSANITRTEGWGQRRPPSPALAVPGTGCPQSCLSPALLVPSPRPRQLSQVLLSSSLKSMV